MNFLQLLLLDYLLAPHIAHRMVANMEEEAGVSDTQYLEEIDAEKFENVRTK